MHPFEFQKLMSAAILERDPSNIANISCQGAGTLKMQEAVEVYSSGYPARLFEVLGETFETVWKVLGDEDFQFLCIAYIEGHPSRSRNLSDYGESFSDFIEGHLPQEVPRGLLADLARFEWAFKECFHSPYENAAEIPDLRNSEPENLQFTVMKSVMAIRVNFPVYKLHGASGDLGQFNEVLESRSDFFIASYRTPSGVTTVEISELLYDFLRSIKEFNFDLEFLASHCVDDPSRAQTILQEIAKIGLLTEVEVSGCV